MARLVITDKPKPRLEVVEPRTRRTITPEEIEQGLGAERVASMPPGGSPMSAYALRQELFHRLRSTGGRPGLDGADVKPKVPMRRSKWKKLEQLAKQVENAGVHPTPAQLASVILDAGIEQFDRDLQLRTAKAKRPKHMSEDKSAWTAPFALAPDTPGDAELINVIVRYGRFVQNFAILELMVVAWLLKVEASEADAETFLGKTRQFDARVRRLQSILRAAGSKKSSAVADRLDEIEHFRDFRNDLLHTPAGVDAKGRIALMGWRGNVALSLATLDANITAVNALFTALHHAYQERFKSTMNLQRTAMAAPPPAD